MSNDAIIVQCNNCGTKNRIPKNRVQERPRCGKCGFPLDVSAFSGRPVEITDATFLGEVVSHPGAVIVDCWAPWCGPCGMIAPVMDELAALYAGQVKIGKLNVDENPSTAAQFGIRSIPTLLFFNHGKKVDQMVGAVSKAEIENRLRRFL
jgi:thioredoxin 2